MTKILIDLNTLRLICRDSYLAGFERGCFIDQADHDKNVNKKKFKDWYPEFISDVLSNSNQVTAIKEICADPTLEDTG